METLWAVLVSAALVVGGLLLLAVLVRMADLGRREGGGPGGDGGSVAVDGACEPGRGSELGGMRRGSARPSKRAPVAATRLGVRAGLPRATAGMPRPLPAWFPGPVAG
jgi:hypothetical protein